MPRTRLAHCTSHVAPRRAARPAPPLNPPLPPPPPPRRRPQETHHYRTLQRVRKEEGDAAADSVEEAVMWTSPPRMVAPWRPIG